MSASPARGRRSFGRPDASPATKTKSIGTQSSTSKSPARRRALSPSPTRDMQSGHEIRRRGGKDSPDRDRERDSHRSGSTTPTRVRSRAASDAARSSALDGDKPFSFSPFSFFSSSSSSGGDADKSADAHAHVHALAPPSVLFPRPRRSERLLEQQGTVRPDGSTRDLLHGVYLGLGLLAWVVVGIHTATWIASDIMPKFTGPWYSRYWTSLLSFFSGSLYHQLTATAGARFFFWSLWLGYALCTAHVLSFALRLCNARAEDAAGGKAGARHGYDAILRRADVVAGRAAPLPHRGSLAAQLPLFLSINLAFHAATWTLGLSPTFFLYLALRRVGPQPGAKSWTTHLIAGTFYLGLFVASAAFAVYGCRGLYLNGFRKSFFAETDASHLIAAFFWDFFFLGKALSLALFASAADHGLLSSKPHNWAELAGAVALSVPLTLTGLTLIPSAYYCASEFRLAAAAHRAETERGAQPHDGEFVARSVRSAVRAH